MDDTNQNDLVLKYYLMLRCLIVIGLGIGVAVISLYFELRPPILPCILISIALIIATWLTMLRKTHDKHKQRTDLLWNLLLDVVALFLFAYFTGGSSNPFIILFALPVIFAAATLSTTGAAVVAISTIAAYTITMFVDAPLNPQRAQVSVPNEYLWGNWYGFVLIVAGITALVARLASNIKERERALAAAQQDSLQADGTIALGTLAAQAAEDLGTPLATIAVLAGEIENHSKDSEIRKQLGTMNEAIADCKDILQNLSADAGQQKSQQGQAMPADRYLDLLIDKWRERNPGTQAELKAQGVEPAPSIAVDVALDKALLTLLDNTARHFDRLICEGRWSGEGLAIKVQPAQEAKSSAGFGKKESHGSGMFLAVATLQRMGGSVQLATAGSDKPPLQLFVPLNTIRGT